MCGLFTGRRPARVTAPWPESCSSSAPGSIPTGGDITNIYQYIYSNIKYFQQRVQGVCPDPGLLQGPPRDGAVPAGGGGGSGAQGDN